MTVSSLRVLAVVAGLILAPVVRAQSAAPSPDAAASAPAPDAGASAPVAVEPATQPGRAELAPHSPSGQHLQVADPYLELHTGPGRGYPVFFVVERHQWVDVELRHTDWFKVRTEDGKEGWVERPQLETTLTEAGGQTTFRDVLLDDYLRRRVEMGAAWGRFKSEPMLKIWTSYRMSETLSLEGTVGEVQGTFSGTDFWHVNLVTEPWSDRRLSPSFSVGLGKFKNFPNQSLVSAVTTDAKLADAALGLRYHLSDRFVARIDYTLYTAFIADTRSGEYHAVTAGLSFFF